MTSFGIYGMSFAKTPTYRAHAEAFPDKLSDLLGPFGTLSSEPPLFRSPLGSPLNKLRDHCTPPNLSMNQLADEVFNIC